MKSTLLLAGALLLAACTGATPPAQTPGTPAPPAQTPPAQTPAPPSPTLVPLPPPETFPPFEGDAPQEVVEAILDEVAVLAGVNIGEVAVVRAQAVTWSDPGLNCPEEDKMYAQVLTEGYWVVLEAGGQTYDFRMAEGDVPRLCPEGQGEPPLEGLPD